MNLLETFKLLRKISEVCGYPVMVEDLFFLLSIHERQNSALDVELQHEIKYYYLQFQFYDASSDDPTLISWVKRAEYLMGLGLLECQYGEWKKVKNGYLTIDILKLNVTEKFTHDILIDSSKKSVLFEYLIEQFGEFNYVNGEKFPNRLPSREFWKMNLRAEQDLQDLFWKVCANGSKSGVAEVFDTIAKYFEKMNDSRSLTRFLTEYSTIKKIVNTRN